MSKVKPLNISALKKMDAQKYSGKKQIHINGYDIIVDEVFRPTTISVVLAQYQDKVLYASKVDGLNMNLVDWPAFLHVLLIKHFTNVQIPDDFESQINALQLLVDNQFLLPIIEQFGSENMDQFNEMLKTTSANMVAYAEGLAANANPEVV